MNFNESTTIDWYKIKRANQFSLVNLQLTGKRYLNLAKFILLF